MKRLLLVALMATTGTAVADPMADYLFAHDNNVRMQLQLSETPRAPWIDDAELRLTPERDAFDLSNETYSFRFRPTGIRERRAMRTLFGVENIIAEAEWNEAMSGAMAKRYYNLLDLAAQEVRTAILKRKLALDQLLLTAESSLTDSSGFSNVSLQDASLRVERRRQEIDRSIHRTVQMRAATVSELLVVSNNNRPSVSEQLLRPRQVEAMLEDLLAGAGTYIREKTQLNVRRAQSEVILEKSRSRFGIDLLELSYEDKLTDSYSVTLGFRVPIGRNKFGLQKRLRETNIARNYAYLEEQIMVDALQVAVRKIRWQIEDYAMDVAAIRSLQDRIQSAAADVASLASLRQYELELLESAAQTHLNLLRDYVNLLGSLGQLPQRKNWIGSQST